jgi:hypothetical protein
MLHTYIQQTPFSSLWDIKGYFDLDGAWLPYVTSFFVSVNNIHIYIYTQTHIHTHIYIYIYRVIKKSLYPWWLQYRIRCTETFWSPCIHTHVCISSTNETALLNTPSHELGNDVNRGINRLPHLIALSFRCDKIEVYDLCCHLLWDMST